MKRILTLFCLVTLASLCLVGCQPKPATAPGAAGAPGTSTALTQPGTAAPLTSADLNPGMSASQKAAVLRRKNSQ